MAIAEKPVTASDLLRMPDDGFRYELVRGVLRWRSLAGQRHGAVTANVAVSLGMYVSQQGLGRTYAAGTGFVLTRDPDTVLAPNVDFVRKERLSNLEPEGYFPGSPDLAVEVIDSDDLYIEVEEKVAEWLDAGTRLVAVVSPQQQTVKVQCSLKDITVLTEDNVLDGGEVVPGWQLPVKEIFE